MSSGQVSNSDDIVSRNAIRSSITLIKFPSRFSVLINVYSLAAMAGLEDKINFNKAKVFGLNP